MFALLAVYLIVNVLLYNIDLVQSKCEAPVKIYEDLHCKPIFGVNIVNLCPKQYDCSHLISEKRIANRDRMCYFDGKWYDIGDKITIPSVCEVGVCRCTERLNFECTKQECPYLHLPDVNRCFLSYVFNECCPQTFRCSDLKNLSTCDVNDTVYVEGELFPSPLDNCKLCVCTKNFDTNYGHNVCRSVPCRMELFKIADLLNNCAPVYLEPTDCCPVDVRCPSPNDISAFEHKAINVNDTYCVYGTVKVPTGIKLVHSEDQYGHITITECLCKIPPLMTCYRTYYS
ncbi:chordin-like protein 1 isoform X2 [Atheta coriaria]|uniref:chordin-like protein 1 isoform X2 n=1 Tax=Dalotia coriaria TaxID=877792 RepID=UPI0031F42951